MARQQSSQNPSRDSSQNGQLSIQEALEKIFDIDGAVGAAVVDYESGMTLGTIGGRHLDMELAGAGNTEVVRAKKSIIDDLDIHEPIEDILVSLQSQYHLLRMCERHEDIFIYIALDRKDANLALARRQVDEIDKHLELT